MNKFKVLIIFLISILLFQQTALAAFRNKSVAENGLGNTIQKEEYPDSNNVEPKIENSNTTPSVISGGIEKGLDITLEDCLKYALGNNPEIVAAMQDVFAANARIKQTWSSYFPEISWQTGYTRTKQLQLSDALGQNLIFSYFLLGQISASQMLYDFGVTQNKVTIKKIDKKGYEVMLTGVVNNVVCEVKKAYYNLQYALEEKRVAEEMVERYEAFYNQAKAFYEAGTTSKVDVTIAEVNLSNAKLNLIQSENAIEIAMAKLNNKMGLPYFNHYNIHDKLTYTPCKITLDEAIETAKTSRPDYKLADIRVDSAIQYTKLAYKSYFPKLSIEGQYQIGGKNWTSNYGYNFGGYLNFPTINGLKIYGEIKEAKALQAKENANSAGTKNNIYYEIQEAYYSMTEKKNSIPVAYLGMKQAKENYDLSAGRYKVGVGNPVELKEASSQYQTAILKYYKTMYDFNAARAELEKSIGKNLMEDEVSLNLQPKQKNKKSTSKK